MHHPDLDPKRYQLARDPEAVVPRFVTDHGAADRPARPRRFLPPPPQGGRHFGDITDRNRFLRSPINARDRTRNEPGLQGNRVKGSCGDKACKEVVVPGCDLAAEA
ncbi:MAG: hypothetical protein HQL37_15110 [Alphaproteobacteria bacterium]|nr:hypothetical protein [Alphaproteobacteria bacterium]